MRFGVCCWRIWPSWKTSLVRLFSGSVSQMCFSILSCERVSPALQYRRRPAGSPLVSSCQCIPLQSSCESSALLLFLFFSSVSMTVLKNLKWNMTCLCYYCLHISAWCTKFFSPRRSWFFFGLCRTGPNYKAQDLVIFFFFMSSLIGLGLWSSRCRGLPGQWNRDCDLKTCVLLCSL